MSRTKKSERPLLMEARKKSRRLKTIQKELVKLQEERGRIERELDELVSYHSRRLGVHVPRNSYLLDMLWLVEKGEDGKWFWKGGTNNKNLAVVRVRDGDHDGEERSVVRYLAEVFGVVDKDWQGILYPLNGTDNINPWQRQKREFPSGQPNNPQRYGNHTGEDNET